MIVNNYPTSIHDASLVSLNFNLNDKNAVHSVEMVFLEEKSKKPLRIVFRDVFNYQFFDFANQNIILDADVCLGFEDINKFFQKNYKSAVNLQGLDLCSYEMTDFISSVGMHGFIIYKSKEISVSV